MRSRSKEEKSLRVHETKERKEVEWLKCTRDWRHEATGNRVKVEVREDLESERHQRKDCDRKAKVHERLEDKDEENEIGSRSA